MADGTVDGDEILSSYFPTVKAHVFISHSHDDVDLALAFSQWLYDCFGIEAFVDHTIWGSGDKLIRTLDNEYSFDAEKKVYNYSTRNLTTSFVHLMLASAISKMIDTCDCLFFLNSPNSLSSDPKGNTTGSPWIFYELLMAKLLKKEEPSQRHFSQGGRVTEGRTSFIVRQTPPIDNLKHLTPSILNMWRQKVHDKNPKEALRILYDFY
ncbi:MAG: toll/interleukin-1 receptor domain-containing protein [Muribaculaceae bacterium]|nr:toll/interleukin-1 receptor domain-containing protein [Muribaculaceae bacterium]